MFKAIGGFAIIFLFGQMFSAGMSGTTGSVTTTLSTTISATESNYLPVTSVAGFLDGPDIVFINSEVIQYTGSSTTFCGTFAVPCFTGLDRGHNGTNAVAHLANVAVLNDTTGIFNTMMGYNVAETTLDVGQWVSLNPPPLLFLKGLVHMLSWDYAFLDGGIGQWFRMVGYAMSLGAVGLFLFALFSVAQGILAR